MSSIDAHAFPPVARRLAAPQHARGRVPGWRGYLAIGAVALLAGALGGFGGRAVTGQLSQHDAALTTPANLTAQPILATAQAPALAAAGPSAAFDPAPLRAEIAGLRAQQERLELGLRLLPGGPAATDALRKRLAALESGPQPVGEARLARNAAALEARITQMEGIIADFLRLQAAANRHGGMESLAQGLSEARAGQRASGTELANLRADVIASRSEAASAGRAARGALALAAASEAAQRTGPFVEAMRALSAALPGDPQVQALAALSVQGAPSHAELQASFGAVDARVEQKLRVEASGQGLLGHMQAALSQQVSVTPVAPKGAPRTPLDTARSLIAKGDLAGTVTALTLLEGPAAQEARGWLDGARRRLDIDARLAAIRAELVKG